MTYAIIIVCVFVAAALAGMWAFARGWRDGGQLTVTRGDEFVSWYQAPGGAYTLYLYRCEGGEGWCYSADLHQAHRFTSYDAAEAATPVYDGTLGIEHRTGVRRIR